MPRYRVTLTRPVMDYVTAEIDVDAPNLEAAKEEALRLAPEAEDAGKLEFLFDFCGDYDGPQKLNVTNVEEISNVAAEHNITSHHPSAARFQNTRNAQEAYRTPASSNGIFLTSPPVGSL